MSAADRLYCVLAIGTKFSLVTIVAHTTWFLAVQFCSQPVTIGSFLRARMMSFLSLFFWEVLCSAAQEVTMEVRRRLFMESVEENCTCSSCYTAYYLARIYQESIYTKAALCMCQGCSLAGTAEAWKARFIQTWAIIYATKSTMEQSSGCLQQLRQPGLQASVKLTNPQSEAQGPGRWLCEVERGSKEFAEWPISCSLPTCASGRLCVWSCSCSGKLE